MRMIFLVIVIIIDWEAYSSSIVYFNAVIISYLVVNLDKYLFVFEHHEIF
jgi:hypothetical protein